MNKTPLHAEHLAAGARMVPFGGWEMPVLYEGIVAEHQHTRTACSLFDICHMGEFQLSGPDAEKDLEHLLTQRVSSLATGQCRYGYLLDNEGGVLDDLTCYRLDDDRFYLVVNAATAARDRAWITEHLSPRTRFEDLSPHTAKLDLQGPESRTALEQVIGEPLPQLGYFRAEQTAILGEKTLLSRTGYTGEWGYELYFPAHAAVHFWRKLLEHDRIRPAGLGARDTLRLEMGYPLHGHELTGERTPLGAARGLFMDLTKDFIGREAILREKERGTPRLLVGLQLESRRAARADDIVKLVDAPVGFVTSGSLAPSLDCAVALAYVDREVSAPQQLLDIDVRGTPLPATVIELPFYKKGTARR